MAKDPVVPVVPVLDIRQFMAEDGSIHYGHLIRFWRKRVLGWTHAQMIVDLYNALLDENDEPTVSIRWWQWMEQMNEVPKDEKRRRLIQTLLNIPPAYLGLQALGTAGMAHNWLHGGGQERARVGRSVDVQEYITHLPAYWRSSKKPERLADLVTRVAALEQAVLYGPAQQRAQTRWLLCQYLSACGNAHRYQGYMYTAQQYLNKAVILAQQYHYDALYVKALYLRGFTSFNRWTNWQCADDRADVRAAVTDFQAASQLISTTQRGVSASLKSAILADGGRALACLTQDRQDHLTALHHIDQAGRMVSASSYQHDACFLRIDADWYFIDKAEALLSGGLPGSALDELENVYRGDLKTRQRYLYTNIIEAEAYIGRGWVDVGIASLEASLHSLSETTSRRHLSHIARIHENLTQNSRYHTSREVAFLGGKLLKVQHPELFS